jgi:uncharacterized RDD family membrane protein YckC
MSVGAGVRSAFRGYWIATSGGATLTISPTDRVCADLFARRPEFVPPPRPARPRQAAWGYRVGATLTNIALAVLAGAAAYAIAKGAGGSEDSASTAGGLTVLGFWLLNAVVIAAVTNGRSLGKLLAGIRVVRESGRRYGPGTAFVRDVVGRLSYLVPLVWLIDCLMPLGEQRQTLRDRMVSTRVMQEPAYGSRRWPLAITATVLTVGWFALIGAADVFESSSTYTGFDREVFVNGCAEDGEWSESECGCVFDYVSARLPYDEYLEANRTDPEDWSPRVNEVLADGFSNCEGTPGEPIA